MTNPLDALLDEAEILDRRDTEYPYGDGEEDMYVVSIKTWAALVAVARAAAAYVAWIERPRDDKEIESPHAAKGRHLYNVLRAALRALTDTNQQPCPGKFTAYLGEMQDAPCSLCGVKYVNHPTDSNQKEK